MSTSNSEWLLEYTSLKANLLQKRSKGLPCSSDDLYFFNSTIGSLNAKLKILASALQSHGLCHSEIARRQVLVENLKTQISNLHNSINSDKTLAKNIDDIPPPDDGHVFGGKNGSSSRSMSGVSGGSHATMYNPIATSEQGLSMRIMEMTGTQDNILNDIGYGVDRLHSMANDMHEEASIHERLLDNMESNIDVTAISLHAEAKRAAALKERVGNFRLYVCLIVEILILFLLLLLLATRG